MAMPDELNEILNDSFGESAEVIDDNAEEQDVVLNVEEAGKAWLWGREDNSFFNLFFWLFM